MTTCSAPNHPDHAHQDGPRCGHSAVRHGDHTDYLHDGHLHHPHEGNVDEHVIDVFGANTDDCTPDHRCGGHDSSHVHGLSCGHEAVPHGNHVDYRVAGHLHHPHGDHCDDHGCWAVARCIRRPASTLFLSPGSACRGAGSSTR